MKNKLLLIGGSHGIGFAVAALTDTPLAGKLISSEEKKQKMNSLHPLKHRNISGYC